MKTLLITDLDNTLYNWVDYFGKSFRGMTHAMSREMGIDEQRFIDGAREVYSQVGTLDYSFLIQKLPFINNYSEEQIDSFVKLSKNVFSMVRSKNLRPYDDVKQTFEFLRSQGVVIVAVTNAPIYFGEARLKQLRLDKYFYGILGWEGNVIPDDKYTEEIKRNASQGRYDSKHIVKRWALPKQEIKPSPIGYLKVMRSLTISHKETYVLGDSLTKDIVPALEVGATSIWARYGMQYDEKNLESLKAVTHWNQSEVAQMEIKHNISADYEIDEFSELRAIVKGPQLNLFS